MELSYKPKEWYDIILECIIKTTLSWICTLHTQDTKKRPNFKSNTEVLVWPKSHENAHSEYPWRGLLLTQQDDNVQSLEHVTTDIKEHCIAVLDKEFLILFGENSNPTNYQLFELEDKATNTIVRVPMPYQKQWDTTNKSKWTWIGSRRVSCIVQQTNRQQRLSQSQWKLDHDGLSPHLDVGTPL